MKIFLSWSGPQSRAIAEALNDWLRRVIQAVKPFYSPEIEKGAKWSNEIDIALEGTSFGIICLTPENLNSPWIHFEAGALSKTPGALIWTFLSGLTPADVPPPLGRFQHTTFDKEDTLQLVKTINRRLTDAGGDPLTDALLEDNFNLFWPQLEKKIGQAEKATGGAQPKEKEPRVQGRRDERAVLDEILELARNQERRLVALETQTIPLPRSEKPEEKRWDSIILRIDKAEPPGVAAELAEALAAILPDAEISLRSNKNQGTDIDIRFKEPMKESKVLMVRKLAAHTIGIGEPAYSLLTKDEWW